MPIKKYKKTKGFTLVELIVVITILAILWSIAFLSFQDFTAQARDWKRMTDISSLKKWLELYRTSSWDYPLPDSSNTVSSSLWGVISYNWIVWKTVSNNVKLSENIKDPLTLSDYKYSISGDKKEYEVSYNLEDDSSVALVSQSFAELSEINRVDWNYSGVMTVASNWNYVSAPGLIYDWISADTSLTLWTTSASYLVDEEIWTVNFTPSLLANKRPRTATEVLNMIKGIQNDYSSVSLSIKNKKEISEILFMNPSNNKDINGFNNNFIDKNWRELKLDINDDVVIWEFALHPNWVTVTCRWMSIWDTWVVNWVTYTAVSNISTAVNNPTSSCTSLLTIFSWAFAWKNWYSWDISTWDTYNWIDFSWLLNSSSSFSWTWLDYWNLSNAKNISYAFWSVSDFSNITISNWNMSNITNMSWLFLWASNFSWDLSWWDLSSVNTADYIFQNSVNFSWNFSWWDLSWLSSLESYFQSTIWFSWNLWNWNVWNIVNMDSIFQSSENFSSDLTSWNTSNLETINYAFLGSDWFSWDLSWWDLSSLNSYNYIFQNSVNFSWDLSWWNLSF